jgi:hypothetical protein
MERVPRAPHAGRRASTVLLDEYLVDDREVTPTQLRHRRNGLLLQAERSSTWVLEEFLEERTALVAAVLPVRSVPASLTVRAEPVEAHGRVLRQAQDERSGRQARDERDAREAQRERSAGEPRRAPRPTRLVPLTARAEIAIG